MYMAEAKEKKDQIFYAGVSVRFSKLLANAFFKAGLGFYARPNSKGDRVLLCLMNKNDVNKTLKNPDEDPDWSTKNQLNVNTSRKIKNKGEAIMLGDKIKFLIAHNANLSIDQNGNLKDEEIAVKRLSQVGYLMCFESELDEYEGHPEKIPLTTNAPDKLFTVEEMVENAMKKMEPKKA